ncbi:Glycosyl transferase, family 1 [Corchorus olitorius]|uniref:Glycosyl transferase, family 1 n=1 Tax=Corchorus olitorius TaxID=93759 RepID=A0A1R3H8X2_9ROSI|nr:Glycosyl transferase, family 1 [Corchorus olitorius]
MEESIGKGLSSLRQGSFKSSLSGRSTPRSSPTYRRLNSSRTPRREARSSAGGIQWFRSNRLVYWLLLITLWAYLGFYVQSRWAHGHNKEEFLGFNGNPRNELVDAEQNARRDLLADDSLVAVNNGTNKTQVYGDRTFDVILAKKENNVSSKKKRSRRSRRAGRNLRKMRVKPKATMNNENGDTEGQEQEILQNNSTYGFLVGPFGSVEERILDWSPEKRSGTCNRKGDFARLVWSRRLVLIFHELSMTGAPISMMELATELLSCGATVSAVVLSKKGGLMSELARRRIKVIEDRADMSFKTAMKADLVIAGSAVCASWIDQYIAHFPAGGSQIAWWIMENRREYFDRSKLVLHRVKMLIFLSELQSKQWLTWCQEEKIKLRSEPALVPLAVNDELAFVAGMPCSLNTPSASPEKMLEKRQLLRDAVRKEMGLTDNDMLVMSLSSINAGKGQLLIVESAGLVIGQNPLQTVSEVKKSLNIRKDRATLSAKHHLRGLLEKSSNVHVSSSDLRLLTFVNSTDAAGTDGSHRRRKMLSNSKGTPEQSLKILIGSVGSKSNKIPYVNEILRFLSQNAKLSESVLWTPATTRVASLYSAADVYVMNSQGLGETFGRVTIEAMAFGLPVLGTHSGGTVEIVEQNVTGLLHPMGHPGTKVLAENLRYLLKNPAARKQMGMEGRKKVERKYLKRHMYKRFVEVLTRCMRSK